MTSNERTNEWASERYQIDDHSFHSFESILLSCFVTLMQNVLALQAYKNLSLSLVVAWAFHSSTKNSWIFHYKRSCWVLFSFEAFSNQCGAELERSRSNFNYLCLHTHFLIEQALKPGSQPASQYSQEWTLWIKKHVRAQRAGLVWF